MDGELQRALAPVLVDLVNATALEPECQDVDWPVPGTVATMLSVPGAGGAGISLMRGTDATAGVVSVADQVQVWVVEALWSAGRSPVWPECPEHPDAHPLRAVPRSGVPVWICPVSQHQIGPIGSLP